MDNESEQMFVFSGKHTVKWDTRGRVRPPADLHPKLPQGSVVYVGPSRYLDSLYVVPEVTYHELTRQIAAAVAPADVGDRRVESLRDFFAAYDEQTLEGEDRRISIAATMGREVGLGEPGVDVVLFGAYDRLEIMSMERWARRWAEICEAVRPKQ